MADIKEYKSSGHGDRLDFEETVGQEEGNLKNDSSVSGLCNWMNGDAVPQNRNT